MRRVFVKLANLGILNNRIFNNILLFFGLDARFSKYINTYNYLNHSKENSSLQEVAGYSCTNEMAELLDQIHRQLRHCVIENVPTSGVVLDIGCGPGLFLKDFDVHFEKYGVDIVPEMIEIAKRNVPEATFISGDIIDVSLDKKFDLIYSVGALMYISKSKMKPLRQKIYSLLNPGGILLLSYPHAITRKDLYYPDISYVQYSPEYVEKLFGEDCKILSHSRTVDGAKIHKWDQNPYVHPADPSFKTYRNSSIIILKKIR